VYGDQAYQGQGHVIRQRSPRAKDFTNQRYRWNGRIDETERRKNRTKSKIRYRGLAKNLHRLQVTCALANLFMVRRRLLTG
jgi:IS5 family transposase